MMSETPQLKSILDHDDSNEEIIDLQPHQIQAANQFINSPHLVLYHSMGSGKTITALYAINKQLDNDKRNNIQSTCLFLVPPAVYNIWIQEYQKTQPIYITANHFVSIVLFVKEYIHISKKKVKTVKVQDLIHRVQNTYICIDEAHHIASHDTNTLMVMKEVSKYAKGLLLLSGTVFTNHPRDISALINLVHVNKYYNLSPQQQKLQEAKLLQQYNLPETKEEFEYKFVQIIDNDINKQKLKMLNDLIKVNTRQLQNTVKDTTSLNQYINRLNQRKEHATQELNEYQQKMQHIIVYLKRNKLMKALIDADYKPTSFIQVKSANLFCESIIGFIHEYHKDEPVYSKSMVLQQHKTNRDFPTREDILIKVPLSKYQILDTLKVLKERNIHFKDIQRQLKSANGDIQSATFNTLNTFLTRTRQISNYSNGYIPKTHADFANKAPKLMEVANRIKEGKLHNETPALVFSFYLETIALLEKLFTFEGISFVSYTGHVSKEERRHIVNNYNNNQFDVLIISKAGGEGLNLLKTRQVHILEMHWNEAVIQQAVSCAIRLKSHADLPINQQHVKVFYYCSINPPKYKNLIRMDISADEILAKVIFQKELLILPFKILVQSTSAHYTQENS